MALVKAAKGDELLLILLQEAVGVHPAKRPGLER